MPSAQSVSSTTIQDVILFLFECPTRDPQLLPFLQLTGLRTTSEGDWKCPSPRAHVWWPCMQEHWDPDPRNVMQMSIQMPSIFEGGSESCKTNLATGSWLLLYMMILPTNL